MHDQLKSIEEHPSWQKSSKGAEWYHCEEHCDHSFLDVLHVISDFNSLFRSYLIEDWALNFSAKTNRHSISQTFEEVSSPEGDMQFSFFCTQEVFLIEFDLHLELFNVRIDDVPAEEFVFMVLFDK